MKIYSPFRRLLCLALVLALIQPATAAAREEPEAEIISILLIGQDEKQADAARSDSIILCSLCPDSGTITITSFLRDLYVPIPGHGSNRINAAYAFGGSELLKNTLEENFEVSLDGWVEVDFSSFPKLIDILGGVTIELRQDEAEVLNDRVPGTLTEGTQLLNGEQALAYSRIRYLDLDGDFSRTSRQRRLLSSLLDSYRSASLLTILSLVVDVLPMIATDLSKKEVLVLAAKLFPLLDDPKVSNQRIPADGTFTCQRIDGMDVLAADLKENKNILHNSICSINSSNK